MPLPERPLLRNIEVKLTVYQGQSYLVLSDPRRFADRMLLVPQDLAMYLAAADGTLTLEGIARSGTLRGAPPVPPCSLSELFSQLDALYMLENGAYRAELGRRVEEYRTGPFRSPALAGLSYEADPQLLTAQMDGYAAGLPSTVAAPTGRRLTGILSPHIDYMRGGKSYAQVWQAAAPALCDAELFVIFGTDHHGRGPRLTLTRQSYATPWGTLPTDSELVERLSGALREDPLLKDHPFEDELNHIGEHSIELAATWLHRALDRRPVTVLPVLCGSLHTYIDTSEERSSGGSPVSVPHIAAAMDILREVAKQRRTVFIAAADLAHVGPAFGDGTAMAAADRARVREADHRLLDTIVCGDRDGFLEEVRSVGDENRICGLAPIYMTLWATGPTEGEWLGYDQCAADEEDGSFVSIAGALMYAPTSSSMTGIR